MAYKGEKLVTEKKMIVSWCITPTLKNEMIRLSTEEGISFNSWAERALQEAVNRENAGEPVQTKVDWRIPSNNAINDLSQEFGVSTNKLISSVLENLIAEINHRKKNSVLSEI